MVIQHLIGFMIPRATHPHVPVVVPRRQQRFRKHFKHDDAKCEDVGLGGSRPAAHALGRHVEEAPVPAAELLRKNKARYQSIIKRSTSVVMLKLLLASSKAQITCAIARTAEAPASTCNCFQDG